MQLSAQNRREVIEDLLDIRIFSSMNGIIKDKIRQNREDVKLLSLKKDNLSDKVDMQKGFIDHLESEANQEIIKKTLKVDELKLNITQIQDHTKTLTSVENRQRSKMEELSFDKTKIKKLGGLRGKITQKVSTLTKELEFFESNTVCPTCTQSIEDEFRLNKIADAQSKETELTQGLNDLETDLIKQEEERESQWINLSKEVSQLSHDISQNNTRISGIQQQIGDLGNEIQTITSQLQNRNSEHEKLTSLQEQLNTVYDELVKKKEDNQYKDFVYSLLKDGGVKSKIIKKYLL